MVPRCRLGQAVIERLHSGSGAQVGVLGNEERCFGKVVEARLLFGVAAERLPKGSALKEQKSDERADGFLTRIHSAPGRES